MSNSSQKRISRYPEQRLAGLRRHAAHSREATYSRLSTAIQALSARGEPITVHTIRAESGLEAELAKYQSFLGQFRDQVQLKEHGN